ncbi:hypothetical protein P7K49_008300 [Saguinus oedipus]|uniref:Uncharacterized protein n=1 Tax=Saguinus oedipus TaxID=9490 RepID=A0ABQ9VXC0_SAGOE|nr:hypothetical protein P7K49_008300 [Saguinus oedipus]
MSPGSTCCSVGLLLTVGWLFLAGLPSARGTNVTAAVQDAGLAREGPGEGEEMENNDSETAENDAPPEGEEDGEGGSPLGGHAEASQRSKGLLFARKQGKLSVLTSRELSRVPQP